MSYLGRIAIIITIINVLFMGIQYLRFYDFTDNSCNINKMSNTEAFNKECIEESTNGKLFNLIGVEND